MKDPGTNQEQKGEGSVAQNSPIISQPLVVLSDHTQSYSTFFQQQLLSEQFISHSLQRLFEEEQVRHSNTFNPRMIAKIIRNSPDYRIVTLFVTLGFFRFEITVYIQDKQSCSHVFPNRIGRQESIIFFVPHDETEIALKCFPLEDNIDPQVVLGTALKQYCFLKVASGLGVGPKLINHCGFDIVFYSSCVQFSMEKGVELAKGKQTVSAEEMAQLKRKLLLLHHFHIAHLDLKPPNIVRSSLSEQLVFIDFGFSKLVEQKVGFKSRTTYQGSISYCSKQMGLLFSLTKNQSRFIDLYYNDSHCLEVTLKQLQERNTTLDLFSAENDEDFPDFLSEQSFQDKVNLAAVRKSVLKLKLKFQIYCRNQNILRNQAYRTLLIKDSVEFIKYLLQFPYYKTLHKIFSFIVENTPRQDNARVYSADMEIKKSKLFTTARIVKEQPSSQLESILLLKLQKPKNTREVQFEVQDKVLFLVIRQNLTKKLLKPEEIAKMTTSEYLTAVTQVVDLRACRSTFAEKIKIWNILSHKCALGFKCTTTTSFPEVQSIFKFILYYFKTSLEQNFQENIPSVIINLVILRALSKAELVEQLKIIMTLEVNIYKKVILVYRLYFITFWQSNQVNRLSKDQCYHDFVQGIISSLSSLKNKENQKLVKLMIGLISANSYSLVLDESQVDQRYQQIKKIKMILSEHREEVMVLAISNKYNTIRNQSPNKLMDMVIDLHQICGVNFSSSLRINVAHFTLQNCFSQNKKGGLISSQTFQCYVKCFQQSAILQNFYFYLFYIVILKTEDLLQLNLMNIVDNLLTKYKKDKTKFILSWFYTLFSKHEYLYTQKEIILFRQIKAKLKQIINMQALNNLLNKSAISDQQQFYKEVQQKLQLYYILWEHGDDKIIDWYQRFKEVYSQTRVKGYFIRDSLCIIYITICFQEQKLEQGIDVCMTQIDQIQSSKGQLYQNYTLLDSYIGKMVVMACNLDNNEVRVKRINQIFQLFKRYNLFEYINSYMFGHQTHLALSTHALMFQEGVDLFIQFHLIAMKLLQKSPTKLFVCQYNQTMSYLLQIGKEVVLEKINLIIQQFFNNPQIKENPYNCLFLSFLLNWTTKQQNFKKITIFIRKKVDFISIDTKLCAMHYLVLHLLFKEDNIRAKRRRLITYISYLAELKPYFNIFLDIIGLGRFKRKSRLNQFSHKFVEKYKKFYQLTRKRL